MWKQMLSREMQGLIEIHLKTVLQQMTGRTKCLPQIFCAVCRRNLSSSVFSAKNYVSGTTYNRQFKLWKPWISMTQFVRSTGSDQGGGTDGSHDNPWGGTGEKTDDSTSTTDKSAKVVKVTAKARKKMDYNYTGNIFITPVRAMNEYLLTPQHLEDLPKFMRRSPYEHKAPLTMYMRSDVEKKAMTIWGDAEQLAREKTKRFYRDSLSGKDSLPSLSTIDIFNMKMPDKMRGKATVSGDEKPYMFGEDTVLPNSEPESFWKTGSARVVMYAVIVNAVNTVLKFVAWLYTGSSSMFSEFIHSAADTMNQLILGLGLYHSIKKPDADHPYGYNNLRYISSLISGVGIFCFGTGLSWYHGIQGFMHPEELGSLIWAIATLMGSLASEGASLLVAINQVKKDSREKNMKFWQYVWKGYDPNVNVVLLEDLAAVVGVISAATCMTITHITGNPFADSLGSVLIGGLLGGVASFIIYTNTNALVGRSIDLERKNMISQLLEKDRMIRSLHDVKATEMGGQVRFKAEVDFDGKEITRAYLYKLDLENLLAEMQALQKTEDAESFMLNHGEKIIDMLGEEVDRIEKIMKEGYPELRHVDLEAL